MASLNTSFDLVTSFAVLHMISKNAAQADRFHHLPRLVARTLQIPWMSLSILRAGLVAPTVVAAACFPEEPAPLPSDTAAWTTRAITQIRAENIPLLASDRIINDTRQRWILCPIDAHAFILARFTLTNPVAPGLLDLLDTLSVHAARVVAASLFWHDDPTTLGVPFNRLTPREWDVLKAIHTADPEKLIADRLAVSPHTFHVHIKRIYRKLHVRSRLSLIEFCRNVESEHLVAAVAPSASINSFQQELCPA